MDPTDLARWTRFAMKGGIGKCVAVDDCVAENPDDLMFMKDDEIIVLLQVSGTGEADGVYLGYCEGVIGKFTASTVHFLTKLKKPVMAKRSSVASTRSTQSSSHSHTHSNTNSPFPAVYTGNTHSNMNSPYPNANSSSPYPQVHSANSPYAFPISTFGAKSPTPPGTATAAKSPTPTFDLASVVGARSESMASGRADSRASSVASRWTKTPLESPVNANFSFNVPTVSTFGGPPSGLREEHVVGYGLERERTESAGGMGGMMGNGNGNGTSGTGGLDGIVSALSRFDGVSDAQGFSSTSTTTLSMSTHHPSATPPASFSSPSNRPPSLPPHLDVSRRTTPNFAHPFDSPSRSNLGLPIDYTSNAPFSFLADSTRNSASNFGLTVDSGSTMEYNPYRASTIQRQIELVQQETEDLHHAFLHSRDASLSSNYSSSSSFAHRGMGRGRYVDRELEREGEGMAGGMGSGFGGGENGVRLTGSGLGMGMASGMGMGMGMGTGSSMGMGRSTVTRKPPPPVDVIDANEEGLATSPLQIVKKSPSLRVVSPVSLGGIGRSVSFGSVVGALGGVGEDDGEGEEPGDDARDRERERDEGGDRREYGEGRYEDSVADLERELEEFGVFGRDEEGEDTARFGLRGGLDLEKTMRPADAHLDRHSTSNTTQVPHAHAPQPPSHVSRPSHSTRPSLDVDISLTSNPSFAVEEPSISASTASSSGVPDSSYSNSFVNRLSIQSEGSDGEVGIGLSLLANLAGGDDDDDSEYGSESGSEYGGEGGVVRGAGVRKSRVSVGVSEEGTVEGLSYGFDDEGEDTEEGLSRDVDGEVSGDVDGEVDEDEGQGRPSEETPSTLDFPMPPTTFAANLISTAHGSPPSHSSLPSSSANQSIVGSPPSHQSPSNPVPLHHAFPPHPMHQSPTPAKRQSVSTREFPRKAGPPTPTSPTFPSQKSPTSPSFSVGSFGAASGSRFRNASNASLLDFAPPIVPRERATSVATNGTVNSNSTWEGASDIYDNYRYSRFSMGGSSIKSTKASLRGSVIGLFGNGEEGDVPPMPERQGTRDSVGRRESRDEGRSGERKRADSDASVYTEGSADEVANAGIGEEEEKESKEVPIDSTRTSTTEESTRSSVTAQRRPAPLELKEGPGSETSPLLHATWGSPMSSHFNDPGMDTARPEFNLNELKDVSAERGVVGVQGAGGMASAMRRRVEGEKSPVAPTFASVLKAGLGVEDDEGVSRDSIVGEGTSGLGQGIVVEDEEELPSRILGGESTSVSPEPDEEGNTTIGGHGEEDDSDPVPTIEIPPLSPAAPPLPPASQDTASSNPGDSSDANLDQYRHHLRPNLRDFKEGGMITVPGTGERRSLFMPHPGAPKPLTGGLPSPGAGPMYVQRQMQTPPPPGAPQQQFPPGVHPHPQSPYPPPGGIQPGQIFMHPGQPPPRPRLHVIQVLRQALSLPPPAPRPMINGRAPPPPRGPTIYGRLEADLAVSVGPVPVMWSLEAPPTKVIQKAPLPQQQQLPLVGISIPGQIPVGSSPLAVGAPPPTVGDRTSSRSSNASLGRMSSASAPGGGVGVGGSPSKRPSVLSLREDMTRSTSPLSQGDSAPGGSRMSGPSSIGGNAATPAPSGGAGQAGDASKPIPRANFFPKSAGMRPRSRSFSDLKSVGKGAGSGLRSSLGSGGEIKKSPSLTGSSANSTSPSPSSSLTPPTAKPVKSSPLRPSPLSHSQTVVSSPALKSPLAQSTVVPTRSESPSSMIPPSPSASSFQSNLGNGADPGPGGMRKLTSRSNLGERSSSNDSLPSTSRPVPVSRSTLPPPSTASISPSPSSLLDVASTSSLGMIGGMGTSPSSVSSMPIRLGSIDDVKEKEMAETRSMNVVSPPMSGTIPTSASSGVSTLSGANTSGGSGMGRSNSLRAKLSLPNLRRNRSRQDEPPSSPIDGVHQDMLFQVQDMEFELVRPNFNQFGAARSSEDSAVLGRDGLAPLDTNVSTTSPATATSSNTFLRPESPAMSVNSLVRSPVSETNPSWPQAGPSSNLASSPISVPSPRGPPPESESQMEAHRNRELKWMNLLSTSQPSQARKSKKVRKLLLEGVPASVRYLVWSHLTDGKARFVPGVYPQLCKRGRVPASEVIEREVARGSWFGRDEQGQLRVLSDAGGGVVQLLQAYLNMVPDIQYTPGLPHIVGQLLLLSPEEDAFWIFISIMDTHIRPYFSSGSIQMEVDSALFSRALEVNDAQVAKKLLVDMGINPNAICQPWFTSLFVGCLPPEYLTRTWDMFLYEGIPFLIRVGLAIVSFVRRQILECTSEEIALSLLHRPPPLTLPPTPENYLSFVYSLKLKDDDVKKQRIKMEAQVKRQTQQQPRAANTAGSISLPRA